MNNIYTFIYFIWFLSEVLLNRLRYSVHTDKQNEDKNSLAAIWITILIVIPLSIYIAIFFRAAIFRDSRYEYIGLAVIIAGIVIRFIAVYSLGKFFTVDVTIREGHQLKQNGFYKLVRHPSYTGSILSFIGFGLSLNNWISLFVIIAALFAAFAKRIRVEENALQNEFGEEYISYKKRTYRLIPWIY